MTDIQANLKEIRERMDNACVRAGRKPSDVQLVAVTKTIETERMNEAIEAGVAIVGENKVQEVLRKKEAVAPGVSWHLIGHLQTNKVRQIIAHVDLIHSLDSLHLAQEIQKRAEKEDRIVKALVEVNVAHEESKFGLSIEAVPDFLESLKGLDRVQIRGLMTVAPFLEDPEDVRIYFKRLKQLFDLLKEKQQDNVEMEILSMGMTNDYEIAIEEGSTMVRIGTGIFGARDYSA